MTAQATPKDVTGTGGVVTASPTTFRGLSIRDTSGVANTVTLFDHASAASGTPVATVALAANGSEHIAAPDGVRCATGLFLQATGAIAGSVWVG